MAPFVIPWHDGGDPPPLPSVARTPSTNAPRDIDNLQLCGLPLIVLASLLGPFILISFYIYFVCYLPRNRRKRTIIGNKRKAGAKLQRPLRMSDRRIMRNTYHQSTIQRPVTAHLPTTMFGTNLASPPPQNPPELPPTYFLGAHLGQHILAHEALPHYERQAYPERLPEYDRIDDPAATAGDDGQGSDVAQLSDYHLDVPYLERLERWMAGVEAEGAVSERRWDERHQRSRRAAERGQQQDASWHEREQRRIRRRAERRQRAEERESIESMTRATYVSESFQFSFPREA